MDTRTEKQRYVEAIMDQVLVYTPESPVYQSFKKWLERQSLQNLFEEKAREKASGLQQLSFIATVFEGIKQ